MEPLRLDPDDPLASVLAWLAALAAALGLDPAARPPVRVDRATAAAVRACLADWSRRLRALIYAKAARLALRLRNKRRSRRIESPRQPGRAAGAILDLPDVEDEAPRSIERPHFPVLRVPALRGFPRGARPGARQGREPGTRQDPAALLDPNEQAALKRRTRAVLLALHDPAAVVARLARRLARAEPMRVRSGFPRPPRTLGPVRRMRAPAPELRPPDRNASAVRLEARPAACRGGGAGAGGGRPLSLDAAAPLGYMRAMTVETHAPQADAPQADAPQAGSAAPMRSRWPLVGFALAAGVIVLDQITKWIILGPLAFSPPECRGTLPAGCGHIDVSPFFDLTMVWNLGVSFGLLKAETAIGRWALVAFALIVAVVIGQWLRKVHRPFSAIALGLVIGGAVGNMIDRVRFGAVVDFLDFSGPWFALGSLEVGFPWVFNVADAAINVGAAFLVLEILLDKDNRDFFFRWPFASRKPQD